MNATHRRRLIVILVGSLLLPVLGVRAQDAGEADKGHTTDRGTTFSTETTTIEGELVKTTLRYDMLGRRVRLEGDRGV